LVKIDWKIIVFLICIFVMVESMSISGLFPILGNLVSSLNVNGIFGKAMIMLLISAAIASFLSNTAVSLIMIGLIQALINNDPSLQKFAPAFYAAIIIGINLSNFLPQGSMAAMLTIDMAKTEKIPTYTYKRVLKVISLASILHLIMGIAYLWILIQTLGM
jgi:Na+/H+ antiporter NhaD/arsenite permease-like protein